LPITRIPSAKPWLMGIANLRGTVITIVDLAHFLERNPILPAKTNRIIVARSGDWHYGLLVDEVIGMRHF
ncbi:MAG: chemotaxis protein CheW, partial [Phycisphaerae bacterium]|nr:chemotaxis protein CheW [Phycisphaerae bacterium]